MRRALALLVLASSFALAGCCACDETTHERGPRRPGDVVRDLRDAITDRNWEAARACFSDQARPPLPAETWPLGPRDAVLAVKVDGDEAVVTLDHRDPPAPTPLPERLTLKKDARGLWKIHAWD